MILVDTSIWIEFLRDKPPISERMHRLLAEEYEVCSIECVFGELLAGTRDAREVNVIEAYWRNITKVPEAGLWIDAGKLSKAMKLSSKGVGLIDAAIIVASHRVKARIWTLDEKLKNVLGREDLF